MATYTENYNLKKPATTDPINIEDLNGNADIIDAALAAKLNTSAFVAFRAATTEAAGEAGIVPAPAAGDLRFLGSDGQWHKNPGGALPDGDEVNY